MYVEAIRVGKLGTRGTERKIDGKYYQYKLPEGFDFVVYKGEFLDKLVASEDGDIYGEIKASNTEKLVYKKLRTEIHTGIKYAVYRFSKKAVKRILGDEEAEKDKKAALPVKEIIFETFRNREVKGKVVCIDGDPNNCSIYNLIEKVPKRVTVEEDEWAEEEFLEISKIAEAAKLNLLANLNATMYEQDIMDILLDAELEAMKTWKPGSMSLKRFVRKKIEWAFTDWKRQHEDAPAIYTYGDWEEGERINNLKESGRKKPGSRKNEQGDVEEKKDRMSKTLDPEGYPLEKYPIKEEPRRVRGRTPLGGIYVD